MPLIYRVLALFVFLAAFANAAQVQVIEGDSRGPRDLSAKKLKAMAAVYLAELGYVPSPDIQNMGVSLSAAGPVMHIIRMNKFKADGQIETDSVVVSDVDDVDDAVETMLTKSFGYAPKTYKNERSSEVFFMDPEIFDVEDRKANLATKRVELSLEELGYKLSDDSLKVNLKMFMMKLKDAYWVGMIRMEGSKVVKGAHRKFSSDESLYNIVYSLTSKVMDPDVEPNFSNTDDADFPKTKVVDYSNTHEARCRATSSAESVDGFFGGLFLDLLCYLSDYVGLEVAGGGKDLYSHWYPNLRFGFEWGFTENHSWLWGLDYAGTMGNTQQSRWSLESVHRFSQSKGLFADIVWGWGHDRVYEGWFIGGDIGYNLLASDSRSHWLSVMLRYDWNFNESFKDSGRISVNLVYNLRGYYSD